MTQFCVSVTLKTKIAVVGNRFSVQSLNLLNDKFGVRKIFPLLKSSALPANASVLARNLFLTYKLEGETGLDMETMENEFARHALVTRFNRPLKKRW